MIQYWLNINNACIHSLKIASDCRLSYKILAFKNSFVINRNYLNIKHITINYLIPDSSKSIALSSSIVIAVDLLSRAAIISGQCYGFRDLQFSAGPKPIHSISMTAVF